ncbi:MAG TPA: MFS transporter [Mycobacteriales bacterium]|nr:MFS transporter [Mycobacteriales bacterium]
MRGRWMPFGVATYAIVALLIGSNLPNPLFPLYAREFNLSPLEITLIFATYTLLVIPALILVAPLSDSWGRRSVFVAAIVVAAAAAGLFAAASSAAWLFAAEAVQALALGALQGSAAPTLVETDPTGNVRRSAAIASAATLGGAAIGPVIAGVLGEYGPLRPRLPYLIDIALLAIALPAALRRLPADGNGKPWRPRRPEVPREMRREFALAGVSAFVGWAVTGLFLALIPSFVTTVVGSGLVVAGGVVALMLAASTVTALLAVRLPSRPVQLTGIASMASGVALLLVAAETAALPILLAATLVAGAGQGLTFMGSLADVNEIAPEDRKANVVAGYYVLVYLATALPTIGVGALAGPVGLRQAIAIFSVVVLAICIGGSLALTRGRRRRVDDEALPHTGGSPCVDIRLPSSSRPE